MRLITSSIFFNFSVYGTKRLGEIYEPISLKAVLIFPKNFLDFRLDTTEKHGLIKLRSYNNENYAFIVLSDYQLTFHEEGPFFIIIIQLLVFLGIWKLKMEKNGQRNFSNKFLKNKNHLFCNSCCFLFSGFFFWFFFFHF